MILRHRVTNVAGAFFVHKTVIEGTMSKKKPTTKIQELDVVAREEAKVGANKKKFHVHDLNHVAPKSEAQREIFYQYGMDKNLVLTGYAGTGKTFLSLYLAFRDTLDPGSPFDNVVIVRSIVPTRDMGFLPGSLEEKMEIYELPYAAICDELFPYAKSYENLKKNDYLEFISTSYVRGTTFHNSVIVVDESQNLTTHELDSIITRMGENCRVIFSGDTNQTDLWRRNDKSGLSDFMRILERMDEFEVINFTHHDIVRSKLVRNYLIEKAELGL